jgi:hypothetical protein
LATRNILLAIEDITERRHATEGIGGSQPAGSRNFYGRQRSRTNAMVFAGAAPALPPTARRAIFGRQPQYCHPLAKKRQGSREQNPAVSPPAILSLFRDGPGGVVGKVSVDRFCDQDALFVSQRLCAHFNRGEVLGSVRQTVGTNEERWLSAELFSVRCERRDARSAVMAELDPQHGSSARLLSAGVSGTGPLGPESGWNPGR